MQIQSIGNNYNTPKQSNPSFGMQIKFADDELIPRLMQSLDVFSHQVGQVEHKKEVVANIKSYITTILETIAEHNANPANHRIKYSKKAEIESITMTNGNKCLPIARSGAGQIHIEPSLANDISNLGLIIKMTDGVEVEKYIDSNNVAALIQNAEINYLKDNTDQRVLQNTLIQQIQHTEIPQ